MVGHGSRSLIQVLSRNFSGETEEIHDAFLSGYPVSRQRFERSTS
jgi:hypothetical protein